MTTVAAPALALRPIEPGDADALRRFHERLSEQSVYRRYHGPHPELREAEVDFLVAAAGPHHIARVAVDADGEIAGVCRVIGDPRGSSGEAAIVVADEAHHRGVGHALLERVLLDAAEAGITTVEAIILGDNHPAQQLFAVTARALGIPLRRRTETGIVTVELDLSGLA